MSHCPEWVRKYKQFSAICGTGNPKDVDNWIEIAEEISKKYDIFDDQVYFLFSMTAAKKLKRYERGTQLWNNTLSAIAEAVKKREKVNSKRVEFILCENGVPLRTTVIPHGKLPKKVMVDPAVVTNGDIKSKIAAIRSALTPGQLQILTDIMKKHDHDDELGALSLALIWAKERMQNE